MILEIGGRATCYVRDRSVSLQPEQPSPDCRATSSPEGSMVTDQDCGSRPTDEARPALLLLFGRVHGSWRCFEVGTDTLRLGREATGAHHVRLDDSRASRRHAEINWSDVRRRHWIRDLDSSNGVHVNGVKVSKEILEPGDVVRVGSTVFRYISAPFDTSPPWRIEPPFVGVSRSLRLTLERAARVAPMDAPVLILGPTGTGKELLAQHIHHASGRTGPMRAVNCAALSSHLVESDLFGHEKGAYSGADSARPGLFRAAQGGTLFLDEVGELPADIQAKLLRALDTRSIRPVGGAAEIRVDVRIIAATNRELPEEIGNGAFRADLFARLGELVVRVDPLRDRPEDIEPLWRHFMNELGKGAQVEPSGAAFEAMALHSWPRNVRQLRQLVREALLLRPGGGELGVDDLPLEIRRARPEAPTGPEAPSWADATPPAALFDGDIPGARQLRQLVEEYDGNVAEVAAFLGKDRKQIYRWLQRHHIDPEAYRNGVK
jgi:DNA-binding NtrC family response regulator